MYSFLRPFTNNLIIDHLQQVRTLLAVQKTMIQDKHCFELYGYDLMLDSELNTWLIEVNASPALTASNEDDYALKFGMLDDMVDIIDIEGKRSGDEKRVGGFDLIWQNGPVEPTIPGSHLTKRKPRKRQGVAHLVSECQGQARPLGWLIK